MSTHHCSPSPIFDAPEFPTLRRIHPLPKRRRTTAYPSSRYENTAPPSPVASSSPMGSSQAHSGGMPPVRHQNQGDYLPLPSLPPPSSTNAHPPLAQSQASSPASFPTLPPLPPLPPPLDALGPNPTAEELIAHADTISTKMALQSYYLPLLGNVQNFLASHAATNDDAIPGGEGSNPNAAAAAAAALTAITGTGQNGSTAQLPSLSDLNSVEFGVHFAAAAAAAAAAGVPMGAFGNLTSGLAGVPSSLTSPADDPGAHHPLSTSVVSHESHSQQFTNSSPTPLISTTITSQEANRTPYVRGASMSGGDGERDTDQIRQPGNTKKRKVPANAEGSPRGGGGAVGEGGRIGSPSSFLDDDHAESGSNTVASFIAAGTGLADALGTTQKDRDRDKESHSTSSTNVYPPPPFPGQLAILVQKKGKLTAATLAGLQHKEMLKARKRQLAAVMGALSHGDTLALDQALSASYPLIAGMGGTRGGEDVLGGSGEALRTRRSKRGTVRFARTMKTLLETPERKNPHPDAVPFPASSFEYKCPSATAERLRATKREVATLRKRFEAELARQAAKAAKMALATANGKTSTKNNGRAKRERQEREREKAVAARIEKQKSVKTIAPVDTPSESAISRTTSGTGTPTLESLVGSGGGGKVKTGKKKKRSALANASNPHHLRNYVPSRLPNSGPADGGHDPQAAANNIWPLPVRFLGAEVPLRRSKSGQKKTSPDNVPLVQLTRPADEWICAYCEYDLFYGDDAAYRKAVRNRKKILKRRQRASERAAAAASGKSKGSGVHSHKHEVEFEEDEDYDDGLGSFPANPAHQEAKRRTAPDKGAG